MAKPHTAQFKRLHGFELVLLHRKSWAICSYLQTIYDVKGQACKGFSPVFPRPPLGLMMCLCACCSYVRNLWPILFQLNKCAWGLIMNCSWNGFWWAEAADGTPPSGRPGEGGNFFFTRLKTFAFSHLLCTTWLTPDILKLHFFYFCMHDFFCTRTLHFYCPVSFPPWMLKPSVPHKKYAAWWKTNGCMINSVHKWLSLGIKSTAAVQEPCISLDKLAFDLLSFFDTAASAKAEAPGGKQTACVCACASVALDFREPVLNLNGLELAGFSTVAIMSSLR